jgi:MFS family permease
MIAMLVFSQIGHEQGETLVLVGQIIMGIGLGISFVPATATVLDSLPIQKAGDGSSVNQITRQVGAAFGVAILGSTFAAVFASEILPALNGAPESIIHEARTSVGAAEAYAQTLLGDAAESLKLEIRKAFANGAQTAFFVAAIICALGVATILYSLRKPPEVTLLREQQPDL